MENYLALLYLDFRIIDSGTRLVIMEVQDGVCEALSTWKMLSRAQLPSHSFIIMCYYPSKCSLRILKIPKNGLEEYFPSSKPSSQTKTLSHIQYFFFLRSPGANICEGN